MSVNCPRPECDSNSFDSERSMKIHYYNAHGESIAKEKAECEICGDDFKYCPSVKSGVYCSDCVESGAHRKKQTYKIACEFCGGEFVSEKEDRKFCSRECYKIDSEQPKVNCSDCNIMTTKYPPEKPLCKSCLQRKRRNARRKELVEMKGGVCSECGCTCVDVLEFHHRNNANKKFLLSGNNVLRDFDTVLKEVEKCDLLCKRCHLEHHCTGSSFCEHDSGRFNNCDVT